MRRACIVYHGTNAANAKRILKNGFRAGTYFAWHMEDAIGYGGLWIFEVVLPTRLAPKNNWQFTLDNQVPPEFIIRLTQYRTPKIVCDNMVLRHMVGISNCTKAEVEHTRKDMESRPSFYSKDELTAYGISLPAFLHKKNKR